MPSYPNSEVEREVRSRVNGALGSATKQREADLSELAASEHAPAPGCGSGPYEQKRVDVYVGFYDALFGGVVDIWFEVLTRQNGHATASDVDHTMKEVEELARNAPRNIQSALTSRGMTAARLPQGTITALGDNAGRKIHGLVTEHRRELQTRFYNQNHPLPKEAAPSSTIINSFNVDSTAISGHGNKVMRAIPAKKSWWEKPMGIVGLGLFITVVGGLILLRMTPYFDKPSLADNPPLATVSRDTAVSGIVVEETTRNPIDGATVIVRDEKGAACGAPYVTSDTGNFQFPMQGAAVGKDFRISASKQGYLEREMSISAPAENVVIQMRRK